MVKLAAHDGSDRCSNHLDPMTIIIYNPSAGIGRQS
jgi:hypothetical protein